MGMTAVDIYGLDWVETPPRYGGETDTEMSRLEGDGLIFVAYICELGESNLSMRLGASKKWFDSSDPADWPAFDRLFGRDGWQKFVAMHTRLGRAGELLELKRELEAETGSKVSRRQLERVEELIEEGYSVESAMARATRVNADVTLAREGHDYDFVRFIDSDGCYLVGTDGSEGVNVKPSEDAEPYDVAAEEWLRDYADGAWVVDMWG